MSAEVKQVLQDLTSAGVDVQTFTGFRNVFEMCKRDHNFAVLYTSGQYELFKISSTKVVLIGSRV